MNDEKNKFPLLSKNEILKSLKKNLTQHISEVNKSPEFFDTKPYQDELMSAVLNKDITRVTLKPRKPLLSEQELSEIQKGKRQIQKIQELKSGYLMVTGTTDALKTGNKRFKIVIQDDLEL